MVSPRGYLFLRFCGGCALKCENFGVFLCESRFAKQHLMRRLTLFDAI